MPVAAVISIPDSTQITVNDWVTAVGNAVRVLIDQVVISRTSVGGIGVTVMVAINEIITSVWRSVTIDIDDIVMSITFIFCIRDSI